MATSSPSSLSTASTFPQFMNSSALAGFQGAENSTSSPPGLALASGAMEDQLLPTSQSSATESNAIMNIAAIFMPPNSQTSISTSIQPIGIESESSQLHFSLSPEVFSPTLAQMQITTTPSSATNNAVFGTASIFLPDSTPPALVQRRSPSIERLEEKKSSPWTAGDPRKKSGQETFLGG
jgi:hypothetical protein